MNIISSGEREAVQIEDSSLPHLGLAHKESDTTIGRLTFQTMLLEAKRLHAVNIAIFAINI